MCVTFVVSVLPSEIYRSTKMDCGNESIWMFVMRVCLERMKFSSLIPKVKRLNTHPRDLYTLISLIAIRNTHFLALFTCIIIKRNELFLNFYFQVAVSYLHFRENISCIFKKTFVPCILLRVFVIIFSAVILLYEIHCNKLSASFSAFPQKV